MGTLQCRTNKVAILSGFMRMVVK